jgi:hypothetical protein
MILDILMGQIVYHIRAVSYRGKKHLASSRKQ